MTFISIIIPTYNRSTELPRAIRSVINQTYKNWELLIIDDGSTDTTASMVQVFIEKNNRINYLKRPSDRSKGANACRNIGIEKAKGELVAFLDSDDEWSPDKLQNDLDWSMAHGNATGIFSRVWIDNGKSRVKAVGRPVGEVESYVDYIFSDNVLTQTSTFVVRKEAARKTPFNEQLQRHQDMDFFIRYGKSFGWIFRNEADTIVHWRQGEIRRQHFDSMIAFFEMYRAEVSQVDKLGRYLTWSWVCAQRFDKSYKNYYHRELKQLSGSLSLKYKVFTLIPLPIYLFWSLLRKVSKSFSN